jgi:hypothetical protein
MPKTQTQTTIPSKYIQNQSSFQSNRSNQKYIVKSLQKKLFDFWLQLKFPKQAKFAKIKQKNIGKYGDLYCSDSNKIRQESTSIFRKHPHILYQKLC